MTQFVPYFIMFLKTLLLLLLSCTCLLNQTLAALNATEDAVRLGLANERPYAAVNKSTGAINVLSLDGQDLLGTAGHETPVPGGTGGSGNSGTRPISRLLLHPLRFLYSWIYSTQLHSVNGH